MIAASSTFLASGESLDPIIHRIVGRTVKRLVQSGKVARQDALDFEQDLYVRVLKSQPAFDPDQSHLYAFVTTVVERSVMTFLRDRRAEKRDPARIQPLVQDVPHEDQESPKTDLGLDVCNVMATLPADLRVLAERLKQSSISEIARDANVSRKVIYRQVRKLRERFADAGLSNRF